MADILESAMEIVKFHALSMEGEILNRGQCENLASNFQNGVQALQTLQCIANGHNKVVCKDATNVYQILHKARVLIEECCKEDWVHALVMQINNKECFRELLADFENYFHTMCEIFCHYNPNQKGEILLIENSMTFYPTSIDVVQEDQDLICRRLSKHLELCTTTGVCKNCTLGQYLQEYLMGLQRVEGGELDTIIFPYKYPRPEYGDPPIVIGKCAGGHVHWTKWMGLECATKVINICDRSLPNAFQKEANILGGLNHPNIIKFFCCGIHQNNFELVMELGNETLSQYLSAHSPLKEVDAVDIMLQIANGMCYLYDMKVAHRDLKPGNVVVTPPNDSQLVELGCIHVKVFDFGISKVEVKDSPEVPTSRFKMGTCGYMAPEAMANELSEVNALKADVFSFGMMCSDILSGEKPSFELFRDYQTYIQTSKRPRLPETYSKALRSLVHECWAFDPSKRLTFLDIQKRLISLKSSMLKSMFESGGTTNETSDCLLEMFLLCKRFLPCIDWLWSMPQFEHFNPTSLPSAQENSNGSSSCPIEDNNIEGTSKLIGVQDKIFQLERQLQAIGRLGIVGMGGIGKSTLAKALSDHISHQFDATCFVTDMKDNICTFAVKHKSKDKQDLPPRPKSLIKAQEMLENIQKTKKILIVVDNVSNQSQLDQLLGSTHKHVVGGKLIASSRDWGSLEQHVPKAGKVGMETLNGNQPMELFSIHAFGTDQSCPPNLEHVVAKIVGACRGLPLSLKVMGACMQGERRLRIWERTLHRLLRARHDGSHDEKIWKTLEISFEKLNDQEKHVFLDIACFFPKDRYLYDHYDRIPLRKLADNINIAQGILESLQNKSLVKVDNIGVLVMHDQLRAMGRMIAESDYVGTRLWDLNYPTFINQFKQKGTELVQGLSFTKLEHNSMYGTDLKIKQMGNLRLLHVKFCDDIDLLSNILKESPKLRWLKIQFSTKDVEYSMQRDLSIHKFFDIFRKYLHDLQVLEVFNCNFLASTTCEYLNMISLRQLTLIDCKNIEDFLNEIDKIVALEALYLWGCEEFQTMPKELCHLTCLKVLSICNCTTLQNISNRLGNLIALEELTFLECWALMKIPEGFCGMTRLKKLDMCACEALEELPIGFNNLIALEELDLTKCKALKKIPEGFGSMTRLKKLDMWECEALEELPIGFNNLTALEELDFTKCQALKKIPEGFGSMTRLKKLVMWKCEALEEVPVGLNNLVALEELNFSKCRALQKIPEGFGGMTKLKRLIMQGCEALDEIPMD